MFEDQLVLVKKTILCALGILLLKPDYDEVFQYYFNSSSID